MNETAAERPLTKPLTSAWDRRFAMERAAEEYQRLGAALAGLGDRDWSAATSCPGWDVRAMAGHCVGMAAMTSSVRETLRQQRLANRNAARDGVPMIDALTCLQVEENAHLTTDELVARLADIAPRAVRGRRRMPWPMRMKTMPDGGVGTTPEKWRMGYLVDTILTRDPWMHRADIAEATGLAMELTPEHDGAIVSDVVRDWAARHGQPYRLTLTGPAGGSWEHGVGGELIEMDAVEFCRSLSGRGRVQGLAGTWVPF